MKDFKSKGQDQDAIGFFKNVFVRLVMVEPHSMDPACFRKGNRQDILFVTPSTACFPFGVLDPALDVKDGDLYLTVCFN